MKHYSELIMIKMNTSEEELIETIKTCHFLLCVNNEDVERYNRRGSISGSVMSGLGVGCIPLLPSNWSKYYNLDGVVHYYDNGEILELPKYEFPTC